MWEEKFVTEAGVRLIWGPLNTDFIVIIIIIIIIIIIMMMMIIKITFNEGTQLAKAVFSGALKKVFSG